MQRNYLLTSILIICTWLNALPVAAQKKEGKAPRNLDAALQLAADPVEFYGGALRLPGNGIFSSLLTKMNGGEADPSDALEAQSIYFYEQLKDASKDQLAQTVEKAREAAKKRYEELKAKRPASKNGGVKPVPPVKPAPAPRKNATIKYDDAPRAAGLHVFRNAAYSPEDGSLRITKTERDNGMDISGTESKTIETPTTTITRSASGTSSLNYDGKQISISMGQSQKAEAVSKTDGKKLGEHIKIELSAALDVCPDADGIIRGTGLARFYNQTTINTGRDLGALTSDTTVELKVTGYVNDAAEMTHFDMEGTVTETTLGYDRALDHGLIDDTRGIEDGKGTAVFEVNSSTPPTETGPNEYGTSRNVPPVLGPSKVRAFTELSAGQASRLSEALGRGVQGIMLDMDQLMRSSIMRWRNYECVDVECVAPKTALKPNESVEVTATSVSKQDLSNFNAKLHATGDASITPVDQEGTPSAVYTLTAPKQDKAVTTVTSTSRRGIGLGMLEIPVIKPKKPPVKTPPPPKQTGDPIWTGSIKAVHTEKEEQEKPKSGRMEYEKTSTNKRWEVVLTVDGTRDLSGGIVNNFYAETEVMYTGREYRETSYASGKMSCSPGPIITSPETRKFEMLDNGVGHQRLLVTISIIGTHGYLSFGAPGINAERGFITKYETNCASYNATNSKTYQEPGGVSVGSPGFEVEFTVDPASPNEVQGTRTVTNPDGSQTVYTWSLRSGK